MCIYILYIFTSRAKCWFCAKRLKQRLLAIAQCSVAVYHVVGAGMNWRAGRKHILFKNEKLKYIFQNCELTGDQNNFMQTIFIQVMHLQGSGGVVLVMRSLQQQKSINSIWEVRFKFFVKTEPHCSKDIGITSHWGESVRRERQNGEALSPNSRYTQLACGRSEFRPLSSDFCIDNYIFHRWNLLQCAFRNGLKVKWCVALQIHVRTMESSHTPKSVILWLRA